MNSALITSSILIVLIAALRPVLRGRIDPRVQYALWLVAALRLLIPVNFVDSAYSALALLERAEEPARVVESIGRTHIPTQSYDSAHAQIIEEYRQQGVSTADLTPRDLMDIEAQARERMKGPTLAQLAEQYARPVWLGGGLVMGLWFLLVNLRLRRRLRGALPVEADCPLPVRVTPELPSPCLCGLFRPKIYVTPAALETPDRLRHVLAHELTHYRHKDHIWALVRCLCLCLYWFDPLVWWAAALSRQDCELACDEGAIRRLGEEERLPYGRTLVDMIAAGRTPLLQTATTMTGGKRRVRERISLIARRPKTVAAAALALAIVLGLAAGCTFTGAPEDSPEPTESAQPTDTLPARLMDVPDELRADVDALDSNFSFFPSVLVEYWMKRPWTDYEEAWGWLLTVYRWNQEQFEEYYEPHTGSWDCFAKDDNFYYVTAKATDVRWPANEQMMEEFEGATQADIDNNAYMTAFYAIRAYAVEQVLATEGVEPFTPDSAQPSEPSQAPQVGLPTSGPTSDPTPSMTPPASGETEPGQFLLDILNAGFSDGRLHIWLFYNNGSGPASMSVLDSERGRDIRQLFSAYDWKAAQEPQVESVPFDSFTVEIYDNDAPYFVWFSTDTNVLYAVPSDNTMDRLYFSADGAENLSRDLIALCPHPYSQCALVCSPVQETRQDTARRFMDDFFAVMRSNGHITDFELVRLDVSDESSGILFDVQYRLKAARPELELWTDGEYLVDGSGWTNTIQWKVCLMSDEEGKNCRFDWAQSLE